MAECNGAMFWDLDYCHADYTLNAQEEILDEKYEVRNNMSQLDQNYFQSLGDAQNSLAEIYNSPLSTYTPSNFTDLVEESEGNFYIEKKFTELTPLKNDSDHLTYCLEQNLNVTTQIPELGVDILPDALSNTNSTSGDEYAFNFDIIALEETEPIKMEEINYGSTTFQLNSFENEFLAYTHGASSPAEHLQSPPACAGFSSPSTRGDDKRLDFEEQDLNLSPNSSRSSSPKEFMCSSLTHGEKSWVREIKVGKNNRPRGPKCWEFVLRLLKDQAACPSLVKWEDVSKGSFRLVDKDKISAIWGNRPSKKKNGRPIKYESFARILRYHYKKGKGKVLPVSEKHLVYKFAPSVMEAFLTGRVS